MQNRHKIKKQKTEPDDTLFDYIYNRNVCIITVFYFIDCGPDIILANSSIYDKNGHWMASSNVWIGLNTITMNHWDAPQKITNCILYKDYIVAYDYNNLFNTTIYDKTPEKKL